jgi:IPT/TIG domain
VQPLAQAVAGQPGGPAVGSAPPVNRTAVAPSVRATKPGATGHRPAPALVPKVGTVIRRLAPAGTSGGRAQVNGLVHLGARHAGAGALLVPAPSSGHPATAKGFTPTGFYSSTQLDNFSANCGFGVNETTIAQSTANPNLLVAGANTYYDNNGNCQDSHAGIYSSSDGGQHWRFEVMPGLLFPSSGDPGVTFDPVRDVFMFSFVEFNRSDGTKGRIGVEASSDGVNWSRNTTLDSSSASYGVDKPGITVDQNQSSPHYGRVAVTWTEFFGNNAVYQEDYTDDAGASWHTSGTSVNYTNHECGNGTSPAFDANGDLMVAWADCSGSVNSVYEEVSTTGGASWTAPSDTRITTTSPIAGAEDPNAADCLLDGGGSAFRCNSFPSAAGDPNSGDAGGQAFFVVWANVDSTTAGGTTANVSQLHGLSTINGGTNWNNGSFSFAFMASDNLGDKFFPAASFSPSGRLTVSYSDREDDASAANPHGKRYDEHQTEAASLTNLRAASYVTYATDGTLGDPGSLQFIGDYAGTTSLDANFDTFPIWTDMRGGRPAARTQDLCYADCFTALSPNSPLSLFRTGGSAFTDFYSFNMDPITGSGSNFWDVVGLRLGSDGSSVDDDTFLAPNRYYNSSLASSAQSPPRNDYTLVNGNSGHAADTVYFPQVHSFSSVGGSYSIEWGAGHIVAGTATADSMAPADVARVYDSFLSTGTKYYFGLRRTGVNTSNYTLALHSASLGSYQGRSSAVADSGGVAPGTPLLISYTTGADPSQFDGLVVLNNNGGSGSYTLYRDTAAPSGTVTIDGGAASTSSTTLSLALSATNPTSGDPVMDMALSVNGKPFGKFKKYQTSATVTLSSGSNEGAKTVAVEFRNGAGAVSTPASASIYLVTSPPTITSVSPEAGSTSGGTAVTIKGAHFAPGSTVKFGSTVASTVTFVSGSRLNVVAPAHSAGTVRVEVITPAGTSAATNSDLCAYGAPTVTSISPSSGPTGGGTTVTIHGTGFVPGATVTFGTNAASTVTFVSATEVKAVSPAHAAGTVHITVTTAAGTSAATSADRFTY